MSLGDKNLAAGFMKQTYGAQSTPDELEYIRLKNSGGGRLNTASLYEETGSMPIAKTLARHYQMAGRMYSTEEEPILWTEEDQARMDAQSASSKPKGDPWEYSMDGDNVLTRKIGDPNWITAQGGAREAILKNKFPDYVSPPAEIEGVVDAATGPDEVTADTAGLDTYLDEYDPTTSVQEEAVEAADDTPGSDPSWWSNNKDTMSRGLSNAAAGLLNVAPHLRNIKDYKDMPGVRAPNLQKTVTTKAPSMEASRQAIIAQGRNAANAASNSPQNEDARRASALAQTQGSLSKLAGQEQQMEARVNAQNAQMQNRANARNIYALNRSQDQMTSRDLAMQRGVANERGNIATKSLGFLGDMNRQKLDRDRMALTERRYDQFGVMQRDAYKYMQENGEWPSWYTGDKSLPS